MRLASELGMALDETKRKTTSQQFVMWCVWLDEKANRFDPLFHYMAAIACEIRRGQVKSPRSVQIKDFLLKFTKEQPPVAPTNTLMAWAKSKWFGFLRMQNKE